MKSIRPLTLILSLLLVACSGPQAGDSIPSGSTSSANTAITIHDKNGKLLPNVLRIQFDVDADGRVQNTQILESTTTPELERIVISKMKNEWRYEKEKPATDNRIVVIINPPAGSTTRKVQETFVTSSLTRIIYVSKVRCVPGADVATP
ncbi:energy transducer TonB [Raoultella ornithinolytica]|nr:energy transducer TonB [Raoultella ornithinolytica]